MPTLAIVDGVAIMMFWNDHAPPHFHARFAGQECQFDILSLAVLEGSLPRNKEASVRAWAEAHRGELAAAWDACRKRLKPGKIGS